VRVAATPLVTELFTSLGRMPQAMAVADAHAAFARERSTHRKERSRPSPPQGSTRSASSTVLLWDAIAECAVFAANKAAWDGWTDEARSSVREAALQAARELPALAQAGERRGRRPIWEGRGVAVTRLTATGRAAFAAATRGVYDKWAAVIGADLVAATEAAVKGNQPMKRPSRTAVSPFFGTARRHDQHAVVVRRRDTGGAISRKDRPGLRHDDEPGDRHDESEVVGRNSDRRRDLDHLLPGHGSGSR
jgi:hypothetical protein